MTDADHDRFLQLIVAYQDVNLSESELAELDHAIQNDDELRALFIATQKRSLSFIELHRQQELDAPHKGDDAKNPFAVQPFRMVALAASLLMAFGMFYFWQRETPHKETPPGATPILAHIVYDQGATWKDATRSQHRQLRQGIIELTAGHARLNFVSGADVTLQGPSALELLTDNSARLLHGQLAARVPKAATGFTIATPAMDVVDRGTVFGVTVSKHSATDVRVFEGAVDLQLSSKPVMPLKEGEAINFEPNSQIITKVNFDTKAYDGLWTTAHGITAIRGALRVVKPTPLMDLNTYYDDSHIICFPEQQSIQLTKPLEVDQTEIGNVVDKSKNQLVVAGIKLRSFLLQFNKIVGPNAEPTISKATIAFDHPIMGVVWYAPRLANTDKMFGAQNALYNFPLKRGLELQNDRDVVNISKDRLSLTVRFHCIGSLDQLRVLVAAE